MITNKEYLEHLIKTRNHFYNINKIDKYNEVQKDIDNLNKFNEKLNLYKDFI